MTEKQSSLPKRRSRLSQNLPEAEKYLIAAIKAQVARNYPEAIKAYENLAKASPDNSDVQLALASLYKDSGDLAKAHEYYQKILTANPKDLKATLESGPRRSYERRTAGQSRPLNRAYSLAIQTDNDEQEAASLHCMALAYGMLNKPEEQLAQ